jgi:hypothetical protein
MQKTLRTGNRSLLPVTANVGISHAGMAKFKVYLLSLILWQCIAV